MSPDSAAAPQRHYAPPRDSRLARYPPKLNSCAISCRPVFCHPSDMIAPTGRRCKGLIGQDRIRTRPDLHRLPVLRETCRHGIVSGIIIPPYFRQATAPLACEKITLRWPGPFGTGFLSPQPPGVVGIGPVRRIVYPHTGPTRVGPFSFWDNEFPGADHLPRLRENVSTTISRHSRSAHLNSGLPKFSSIVVQVGNSRPGWRA